MKRWLLLGVVLTWAYANFVDLSPDEIVPDAVAETASVVLSVATTSIENVTAKAYGVFDMETGEMLFGHNVEELLPIASVSKLATAAALLSTSSASGTIIITDEDVATEGRAGKLESGDQYVVHDLLFPLLLESSNDAATAIKRLVNDIPFSDRVLSDASGLSDENKASVQELASEVRRLYVEMPHIFDITRLKQYVGDKIGWVNNSPVIDLPGYLGGKHGYTEAANKTLTALFEEPSLDNRVLEYVVLGSEDVRADTLLLRAAVEESVTLNK